MKKILALLCFVSFMIPVFAVTDVSSAEAKYQAKIEKAKKKQELHCIKHPEKCINSPVSESNITLGVAQKNIKIGTSQDEVAMALGSPNIITVDSEGRDTWIYDKVASVTSYNNSGFNIGLGAGGGSTVGHHGLIGGLGGAGYGKSSGSTQSNQRTLTIVIKFTNSRVSSFQYHMSSF